MIMIIFVIFSERGSGAWGLDLDLGLAWFREGV